MARRRSRRSLGSPPQVHTAEAARWYERAQGKAGQATQTIQAGNCSRGFKQLLHAAENNAIASAHHDSAGAGVKIDGAHKAGDIITNAETLFLDKCVRR